MYICLMKNFQLTILLITFISFSCVNKHTALSEKVVKKMNIVQISRINNEKHVSVKESFDNQFFKFWKMFRKAVLENDTNKILNLTNFPFETRGPLDIDPIIKVEKLNFLNIFNKYLKQSSGMQVEYESQLETIRKNQGASKKQNKYFSIQDKWSRAGDLEFRFINGKWKLSFAYLDYETIEELDLKEIN
jgi:hypothetical protein